MTLVSDLREYLADKDSNTPVFAEWCDGSVRPVVALLTTELERDVRDGACYLPPASIEGSEMVGAIVLLV